MRISRHPTQNKYRNVGDQFCACGSGNIRFPVYTELGEVWAFACSQCLITKDITTLQDKQPIKDLLDE